MMDVKELIIAGAEAAQNMGIGQLLWTGELENNKKWKEAFERVAECRRRCLESMSNPRVSTVFMRDMLTIVTDCS